MKENVIPFDVIPNDVKPTIFGFMPKNTLANASFVSKEWSSYSNKELEKKLGEELKDKLVLSEEELEFIQNNGGFRVAYKIFLEIKQQSNPSIKNLTTPIEYMIFLAWWGIQFTRRKVFVEKTVSDKEFFKIASKYPICSSIYLSESKKSFWNYLYSMKFIPIINDDSESDEYGEVYHYEEEMVFKRKHKERILSLASSDPLTAKKLFEHDFFNDFWSEYIEAEYFFELLKDGLLENAEYVFQTFYNVFIEDENGAEVLCNLAKEKTELAKIILQYDEFIDLLAQPMSHTSQKSYLPDIALSNIETAEWIFSQPDIVEKFTQADLKQIFENDEQSNIPVSMLENLYQRYLNEYEDRQVIGHKK